jgi:DNA polymerase I-like protein with 3'-5' exonuclease and polymerase domains
MTTISDSGLPQFLVQPNPEVYLSDSYVVVDFEITTFGKGLAIYPQNRIVSCSWRIGAGLRELAAQFGWKPNKSYYRRGGEFDFGDLCGMLRHAGFVVAHNAKFDLQWLARCGLELENVLVYDTMLGEYVLGGNRWLHSRLSLDVISKKRFGTGKVDLIKMMWGHGIPTEDIPEEWLERYCVRDVLLTERLLWQQREELHSIGLLPVLYNRCLLTPVLADIERNGMQLDANVVRTTIDELNPVFVDLERKLTEFTGGINFNSGKQIGKFLYDELGFAERSIRKGGQWIPDRTPPSKGHPNGQRKTDADTIAALKAKTPKQEAFLNLYIRYREVYFELTKYLRKMLDCCDQADGRLTATINQANTQTHRLSSTGLDYSMQFQNFPRAYKPLFKARKEGWLIGECDGAQLEFRDAVHLGRDRVGLADIVSGADIHSTTASVIWPNVSWDGTGKHPMRQPAKERTFKPLYGGSSGTEDEYKGIANWQQRNIDYVLNHKYLVTEWGLRYYWPDTRMESGGYVRNSTAICNYPVQAQATAEMIPIALVWFWHRLKRSGLRMFIVNTVHDSIVCELPPDEVEAFHELSRRCLIDDVYRTMRGLYNIDLTVPLGAGVSVGTHWGSKDETVYNADEKLWIEAARAEGMI